MGNLHIQRSRALPPSLVGNGPHILTSATPQQAPTHPITKQVPGRPQAWREDQKSVSFYPAETQSRCRSLAAVCSSKWRNQLPPGQPARPSPSPSPPAWLGPGSHTHIPFAIFTRRQSQRRASSVPHPKRRRLPCTKLPPLGLWRSVWFTQAGS